MPTTTQLASVWAGIKNPSPDLSQTPHPLHAPRPHTKVARGRCRWGLASRPAWPALGGEVLPPSHLQRSGTPAGPRGGLRSRGSRPPPSRARGRAAPDSGLSSRGNLPRAAPRSFLSHPPRPGLGGRSARGPGRGLGERISAAPTTASSKGRAAPGPAPSLVGLER